MTLLYDETLYFQFLDSVIDNPLEPTWRLKDRMKTLGVCMILALNIGTDPPDLNKPSPCATKLCWLDPSTISRAKARELVGSRLEEQYSKWQQRVKLKYKQALDPTLEEVRALCLSMRRNAKSERLLLHYNGHGVPRPTSSNGEIWVFDRGHTQYIPLSVEEQVSQWVGKPVIAVLDCSHAGVLIPFWRRGCAAVAAMNKSGSSTNISSTGPISMQYGGGNNNKPKEISKPASTGAGVEDCIILCPCSEGELLPMNPEFPADIFTSCLTTPIPIALRWFVAQNPLTMGDVDPESVDLIPGKFSDRRSPLGELNWIFTAVTDTIAWNVLSPYLFQKLFRQDLLVASMFRNFLLADRILRSLNCTPVSFPSLPPTANHPLWQSWDLAVESCMFQLLKQGHLTRRPSVLPPESPKNTQGHIKSPAEAPILQPADKSVHLSTPIETVLPAVPILPSMKRQSSSVTVSIPFFAEQLAAFEVWLKFADKNNTNQKQEVPEQLPIVLQVLLSQSHRKRALILLRQYLDLGNFAVNAALSVGIHPYVLKLLQSPIDEYKHVLVGIWARILAFDTSCRSDLVKENALPHFVNHLTWGSNVKQEFEKNLDDIVEQRAMAAYILSVICNGNTVGQAECVKANLHGKCFEILSSCDKSSTEGDHILSKDSVPPKLRSWLCITLRNMCRENKAVQNEFYRKNIQLCLIARLDDSSPDVRASAAFALGAMLEVNENTNGLLFDQSVMKTNSVVDRQNIPVEKEVMENLIRASKDGSPSVRQEVLLALTCSVRKYISDFISIANQESVVSEEEGKRLTILQNPYFDSELTAQLKEVWSTLKEARHSDPHSFVSSVSNSTVGYVHEQMFLIRSKTDSSDVQQKPSPVMTMTHSHSMFFNPSSPVHTPKFRRTSNPRENITQPGTVPKMRRNVSELFGWGDKIKENDNENNDDDSDACSSTSGGKYKTEFEIPRSKFYDYKKQLFFGTENVARFDSLTDALSPEGLITLYRTHRNDTIHNNSLVLVEKFSNLSPSVSSSAENNDARYEYDEDEDPQLSERIKMKESLKMRLYSRYNNTGVSMSSTMCFHPYEPALAISGERDQMTVWGYGSNDDDTNAACKFSNGNNTVFKDSKITSSCWIDPAASSHLLTSCSDGSVRVWADVLARDGSVNNSDPKLLTGFHAIDLAVGGQLGRSGLITEWQEFNGQLIVGGSSNSFRCWDIEVEKCVSEIATNSEVCVTTITTAWDPLTLTTADNGASVWKLGSKNKFATKRGAAAIGPDIFVAGFGDGCMKVFDLRIANSDVPIASTKGSRRRSKFMNYTEHKNWIVDTFFTGFGGNFEIASGSISGDIRFWDLRYSTSIRTLDIQKSSMTAMAVHPRVPLLATGSHARFINICSFDGDVLSVIRHHTTPSIQETDHHAHQTHRYSITPHHDTALNHSRHHEHHHHIGGVGGDHQRISPVSCLAFHPHTGLLAAGFTDDIVSLYCTNEKL